MNTTTNSRFNHAPYILKDGPHRLLDTASDFTEPFVIVPIVVGTPMILGTYAESIERTLESDSTAEPVHVGDPDLAFEPIR